MLWLSSLYKTLKIQDTPSEEPHLIEELPEQVEVIETVDETGKPKRQIVKTRVIKKKSGTKEQITEIISKQDGDLPEEISVNVYEVIEVHCY